MRSLLNIPASLIWATTNAGVRALRKRGYLPTVRLPSRVISVGNLQAGGSGKTPLVAAIAREALSRGKRVCVLTRGYGGAWEKMGGVIPPESESQGKAWGDAAQVGDEVALLHDLVPEAWIGVGADRVAQFRAVEERLGGRKVDLVLLDDGFQHGRIERDVDLLAVTSLSWREVIHREWRWAARDADLLVWTKGEVLPRSYGRPLVRVSLDIAPATERGPWFLITGVGDPGHVEKQARAAGYEIRRHWAFPDHARYTEESIRIVQESARSAGCRILLTGKDWVKWRSLGVARQAVVVLEPQVRIVEGRAAWEKVLWGN